MSGKIKKSNNARTLSEKKNDGPSRLGGGFRPHGNKSSGKAGGGIFGNWTARRKPVQKRR